MKLSSRILILVFACMLLLTSCATKEENADNKVTATIGATATATPITETTGTPDVTPTEDNEVTTSPTEDTTPQVTTPPVEETTAPIETTAPVTKPPVTTAPETTAPIDNQPIADPEQFPDDWGYSYAKNAVRTDFKYIVWTKTRHLVEVPEEIGEDWYVEDAMIDANNEQMHISTGSLREGTSVRYALVNGVFYKLSEEKIVKVTIHNKQFAWIEEDGTAYSINIRTKWFNEVYVEAIDAGYIFFDNNELVIANREDKIIEKNEEDVLREVKKVSN